MSNFCTMNPLNNIGCTLSEGNLHVDTNLASGFVQSTFEIPQTGKWYFECLVIDNSNAIFGIASDWSNYKVAYNFAGQKEIDSAGATSYGASYAAGDVIA